MENESGSKKRVRDDSDEFRVDDSPEVKRLRENLLEDLDDDSDLCTASQDLDSFMRSFEEEITASPSQQQQATETVDLGFGSAESRLDLGYLLEASDDELGLPPSNTSPSEVRNREENDLARVVSDSSELGELWGFDDQIQSYESLEFAVGETDGYNNGVSEYVTLDGLFDHSDLGFGSSDNIWRPETLPAQ